MRCDCDWSHCGLKLWAVCRNPLTASGARAWGGGHQYFNLAWWTSNKRAWFARILKFLILDWTFNIARQEQMNFILLPPSETRAVLTTFAPSWPRKIVFYRENKSSILPLTYLGKVIFGNLFVALRETANTSEGSVFHPSLSPRYFPARFSVPDSH